MAAIKESSQLTLYAGVDIDKGLQVIFKSKAGQDAYFASKKKFDNVLSNLKFSYIRRSRPIKVQLTTAQVAQCDYLSFINPSFENKRFYAKIVDYEYVSNNVTRIEYALDDFQTYMFDVTYEGGYIEREHISEADYEKAEVNAFDPSIYEFRTAEQLQPSKEMEIKYEGVIGGHGGSLGGDWVSDGFTDDICSVPQLSTISDEVMLLQIADFDTENVPYSDFLELFNPSDVFAVNTAGVIQQGYSLYATDDSSKFSQALKWLTYQGLVGQVIGAFSISSGMWSAYKNYKSGINNNSFVFFVNPRKYEVKNKKLLLYPYQYLRVQNNEGDTKEYRYEWMLNSLSTNPSINSVKGLKYLAMFDGVPMVSLAPMYYKQSGFGFADTNISERIDSHQIPQIGYTTDAYLAFLATQYQMNLSSRTASVGESINQAVDKWVNSNDKWDDLGYGPGGEGVGALRGLFNSFNSGVLKNAGQALGSYAMGNVPGTLSNAAAAVGGLSGLSTADVRTETTQWRSGHNDMTSKMFAPAKGAFVADDYHAGSGNGTVNAYANGILAGSFLVTRVKLRDDILSVYDEYFSGYGYTSGRVGVPRVCNYINGTTDTSKIPVFMEYLGKDVTYVKTSNIHVIHTIASVSENIEEMFNTGCQFIKGDLSNV